MADRMTNEDFEARLSALECEDISAIQSLVEEIRARESEANSRISELSWQVTGLEQYNRSAKEQLVGLCMVINSIWHLIDRNAHEAWRKIRREVDKTDNLPGANQVDMLKQKWRDKPAEREFPKDAKFPYEGL